MIWPSVLVVVICYTVPQYRYRRVRTADLEKKLSLSIGAKVMLKRNHNADYRLVIGSIATVVGSEITSKRLMTTHKHHICEVQPPWHTCKHWTRIIFIWSSKICTFYPLTVPHHASICRNYSQISDSLQTAIVDAGPVIFGPGMIYVGLSRVTTPGGLHLVDLDRAKIVCDNKAIRKYNRLWQLYTPHHGDIRAEMSEWVVS